MSKVSSKERIIIYKRQKCACIFCGKNIIEMMMDEEGPFIYKDIPIRFGGKNDINNLILTCRKCGSWMSNSRLSAEQHYSRIHYGFYFPENTNVSLLKKLKII